MPGHFLKVSNQPRAFAALDDLALKFSQFDVWFHAGPTTSDVFIISTPAMLFQAEIWILTEVLFLVKNNE